MSLVTQALWIVAPGVAELRPESLPAPAADQVVVRAELSGISRGTESLVFHGRVPPAMVESMRCPHQAGELSLPVKYGYCSVGRVERGPAAWVGKRVFCLHPHQERYVVSTAFITTIPDEVPSARAVLAANMETAVNALWDARPPIGGHVSVVGAGAVGLLVAHLLSKLPGVDLEVVEICEQRAELARRLSLHAVRPEAARGDRDLVVHASGSGAGLQTAVDLAGVEASVLELSWYGEKSVTLRLGGHFHDRRLHVASSQVGSVATSMRARWSHARRMQLAVSLLREPALDALIGDAIGLSEVALELPRILSEPSGVATHLIAYP